MQLSEFEPVFVDFEFRAGEGERPIPVCLVAHFENHRLKLWQDDLNRIPEPPYPIGRDHLLIAYYSSAEMTCHRALGWRLPWYVLDLFAEFRVLTNGLNTPCGNGLLGALAYFGLDSIDAAEKDAMRVLAMRDGPFTAEEKLALLDYCESDVIALKKLLGVMAPHIDLPRALLRGRYMKAAANIEWTGVPVNVPVLGKLRDHWSGIQDKIIERTDSDYGVFEGRTFRSDRFERLVAAHRIPWPKLRSGKLKLDDETFRDMSRSYPIVNPIRELRVSLSQLRLNSLAVGCDGRNRTLLSAFRSKTGRNQPSNAKSIFGPAVWLRNLIQPEPGYGLAYIDWSQQEFAIAAVLSGDEAMINAYLSGDPYLEFAKQAGAAPPTATKQTHTVIREQYKACVLAVQYGMGTESLAARLGKTVAQARELLRAHHQVYRKFWKWSDGVVCHATLLRNLYTVFGWKIQLEAGTKANERSLRNFPMQANGAEMLRLACSLATERGILVCAPVHDAILVEAPLDRLEEEVARTQQAMAEASAAVLGGFELRSDAKLVRWPDHYSDPRGDNMWRMVCGLLEEQPETPTTPTDLFTSEPELFTSDQPLFVGE